MSETITLSGWGQPYDALGGIAPGATHVDYTPANSVQAALDMLAAHAHAHTVVGWSMGGQLAVRAIAEGVLQPQKLVLLATPFRFAADLGPVTLERFRNNFLRDPERTFDKSYALIAHLDTHGGYVEKQLQEARRHIPGADWLYWLDTLSMHSSEGLDFRRFPPTALIHGDRDVVVNIAQSRLFQKALPRATLHVFEGCGHAPHWHDEARVRSIIT